MRSLPLRILVVTGAIIMIGSAAWALPAAEAERPTLVAGSYSDSPSAPDVDLPEVGSAATREVPPAAVAPSTTAAPAVIRTESAPDHLADEAVVSAAKPDAVVTTTTAPPTTTTVAPVVTVAFTATQAYKSCDADVPYDLFSGNGTPGSSVTISSPYGSGSTTVNSGGHWEKKVEFPSAPAGETFSVTASGLGGSVTLHFTARA